MTSGAPGGQRHAIVARTGCFQETLSESEMGVLRYASPTLSPITPRVVGARDGVGGGGLTFNFGDCLINKLWDVYIERVSFTLSTWDLYAESCVSRRRGRGRGGGGGRGDGQG